MGTNKEKGTQSGRKVAIIFIAVFLSLVLLFGAIVGVILIVRNANAALSFSGTTVSKGVASYLAATFKTEFIAYLSSGGVYAYDDPEFWAEESDDGLTYGDILKSETENYIKNVLVSSYLFDRYSTLSASDKESINKGAEEVLAYKADGNRAKFDELAAPMGFNYDDFKEATTIVYKAERAMTVMYGNGGEILKGADYYDECDEYFENYSHVKLLFIRTEDEIIRDDNGNFMYDGENNLLTRTLEESEKATRNKHVGQLRDAIEALKNNTDGQITADFFENYFEYYSYYPQYEELGFYLADSSSFTSSFRKTYPTVVDKALSMSVGEFSEVEFDGGVCFIYKYPNTEYDYMRGSTNMFLEAFFEDFYIDTATYLQKKVLDEYRDEVVVNELFYEIDIINLPYNSNLFVRA